MAARLSSRVAFHLPLPLLSPTRVHPKMPKNVFRNTLLSSSPDVVKLRSQFATFIAQTEREREGGRDRTRRISQSGYDVLFMVGGFALTSLGDETPKTAEVSARHN